MFIEWLQLPRDMPGTQETMVEELKTPEPPSLHRDYSRKREAADVSNRDFLRGDCRCSSMT